MDNKTGIGTYGIRVTGLSGLETVTIAASTKGTLVSADGFETVYTNQLSGDTCNALSQSLTGTVTVETPKKAGSYTGTIQFTITYDSGAASQ